MFFSIKPKLPYKLETARFFGTVQTQIINVQVSFGDIC